MDKILSKDTIKNVFSALGAKTSDSNYGVALLDKTSGEPKGLMGMSDLASVLGGCAGTLENQTWDSLLLACAALPPFKPVTYFVKGTVSGMLSSAGTLITFINRYAWQTILWNSGEVHGHVVGSTVNQKNGTTYNDTPIEF